jgi:hypothetical protein
MTHFTEQEVAYHAHFMGYHLLKGDEGYALMRHWRDDKEIVSAPSLELIADFLKH